MIKEPDLLVVFTTGNVMNGAGSTADLRPLVLRPDQLHIDQVVYINVETRLVGHHFLLPSDQPFVAITDDANAKDIFWMPNDPQLLEEFFEPSEISQQFLNRINATLYGLPALHHEACSVCFEDFYDDVREEFWNDWLYSEILDQRIINQHSDSLRQSINYLKFDGGDSLARLREIRAPRLRTTLPEPMKKLPTVWEIVVPDYRHGAMLRTLNSVAMIDSDPLD